MAKAFTMAKWWYRFLIFSFSGIFIKFFFDVIFSLIYRNYELIQPLASYAWSVLLALVIFEGIFRINNGFARRIDWEKKLVKRLLLQFISSGVYAVFWIIVVRIIISFLFFEKDFIRLSDESIYLVMGLFIVALITAGDLGLYLFRKWRISLVEIEKYKKEKAEFHLGMLQAQINPHFLFNSLNTLSSLIYEDQKKASEYTRELADVYRYVLDSRKKELVSLAEEKSFTESFINLYKTRFDQKLSFDFKIEDTSPYSIPPLIIQLLVENAVKHNIVSQSKPLKIEILQKEDTIVVKNNLQEKRSVSYSSEVGLDNIVNRYKYFTEKKVEINKTETDFIVKIPLIQNVEQEQSEIDQS